MSHRIINTRTAREHDHERAKLRRWRPRLRDLFRVGSNLGDTRQATSTKKGPGRRHVSGYSKRNARALIEAMQKSAFGEPT